MLQLHDHFDKPASGLFHLDIFRGGKLIEVFEEKNLIVDLSKQTHARLLGGDVTNRSVSKIGFGTNGTAPAAGNTVITGIFSKNVDSVTYPLTNQVTFAFSLAAGENNGMAIMEFGLLTTGNVLYARKTRALALNKDSDISLTGSWTITF